MTGPILQWLVIACVAVSFWLIGESRIHVLAFGWFTAVLAAMTVAATAAIVLIERRRRRE